LKNDDAISHYNLANVLRVIGNYDQSILHYEYVISSAEAGGKDIGTLNVDSLVNLGICYKLTKQYEKAIDYFEKARRIDSNDEAIIFNEGMAYMANLETINPDIFSEVSKEKALKAESLFKQLSSSNPNHEMATLKLYRISSILDKSNSNLNDLVRKLKDLLSNPKSAIKDEIN
jgi:tetratricopeptide (TPR) repeat protein